MSYSFECNTKENDYEEIEAFVDIKPWGEIIVKELLSEENYMICIVTFVDKRAALLFKTKFTARLLHWDESDDEEIVTEEELRERGYQEYRLQVEESKSLDFERWCKKRDIAVVDEFKFFRSDTLPYRIWCRPEMAKSVLTEWDIS